MAKKRIPSSASHVKFENERGQKCTFYLEICDDVVTLQMTKAGAKTIHRLFTPIEAAELREALLLLPKLPKSRGHVIYPRAGRIGSR